MLHRQFNNILERSLGRLPVVVLVGPRRCGKTSLAKWVGESHGAKHLDLANYWDRSEARDLEGLCENHEKRLVVLDEVHRVEGLFAAVKQEVARVPRMGRFLLVGSAGVRLLKQDVGELADVAKFVEMGPLMVNEVEDVEQLWLRGGMPASFNAESDWKSYEWRREHVRKYLELDVRDFRERVVPRRLEQIWTMLAHRSGKPLKVQEWVGNIQVSQPTVWSHTTLFEELLLVRGLVGHDKKGNRVKGARRWYVRDSGLLHAALGIVNIEVLSQHPMRWASWEGFVIENLLAVSGLQASHYKSEGKAKVPLVLKVGGEVWAIGMQPAWQGTWEGRESMRGLTSGAKQIGASRVFIVHGGKEREKLRNGVEVVGIREMMGAVSIADL